MQYNTIQFTIITVMHNILKTKAKASLSPAIGTATEEGTTPR
jgi:hypothetical protein